jgi:hypothetical protein
VFRDQDSDAPDATSNLPAFAPRDRSNWRDYVELPLQQQSVIAAKLA